MFNVVCSQPARVPRESACGGRWTVMETETATCLNITFLKVIIIIRVKEIFRLKL